MSKPSAWRTSAATRTPILEQRIGRVHRLGQTRPVQVVSLVAQGTIEEGMLGLLGFKRALFAGVLDGGEHEVFLGGSRLTRFMESVEKVTAAVPAPAPVVEEPPTTPRREPVARGEPGDGGSEVTAALGIPGLAPDAFQGLLEAGADLLKRFVYSAAAGAPRAAESPRPFETVRDAATGQTYVKIRLPEPEVIQRVVEGLRVLLESVRA